MVQYNCDICNFTSYLKSNYNRHLETKKHLENSENSLYPMVKTTKDHKKTTKDHKKTSKDHKKTTKNTSFTCEFCIETFTTYAHKRRHELHYCKHNSNNIKILNDKNKLIKTMQKQIDKLIEKSGNTTITNNIQTNIQINSYGNEDLSHITDSVKKAISSGILKTEYKPNTKPEITNIQNSITRKIQNVIFIFLLKPT